MRLPACISPTATKRIAYLDKRIAELHAEREALLGAAQMQADVLQRIEHTDEMRRRALEYIARQDQIEDAATVTREYYETTFRAFQRRLEAHLKRTELRDVK